MNKWNHFKTWVIYPLSAGEPTCKWVPHKNLPHTHRHSWGGEGTWAPGTTDGAQTLWLSRSHWAAATTACHDVSSIKPVRGAKKIGEHWPRELCQISWLLGTTLQVLKFIQKWSLATTFGCPLRTITQLLYASLCIQDVWQTVRSVSRLLSTVSGDRLQLTCNPQGQKKMDGEMVEPRQENALLEELTFNHAQISGLNCYSIGD